MLPLRLRSDTNRRAVGWLEVFRPDVESEINQAGGRHIFAGSLWRLRDKSEPGKGSILCVIGFFGHEFDSPRPSNFRPACTVKVKYL
jgi:hypothetical protein